ncbi:STAS domain-containing protein [Streptomyces virginiae]|uniref:STAS domain-containing protein n=1 Tax=Streptomyces TaxID=1883 RepID=UPI002DDBBB13|nr:STAS domain-containing protein [Streptomyces virginiae]WSC75386.1 STAS domain-containing protein [Streptomyces virginiae]
MDFRMPIRRYGPIVHLTPAGELDLDTRSALDETQAALDDGVVMVACDMRSLRFIDVTGLRGLLEFVRRLDGRGIAFFADNWQPQPRRLLDLLDSLYPPADFNGNPRCAPTSILRRGLQARASARRTAGARVRVGESTAGRNPAASRPQTGSSAARD